MHAVRRAVILREERALLVRHGLRAVRHLPEAIAHADLAKEIIEHVGKARVALLDVLQMQHRPFDERGREVAPMVRLVAAVRARERMDDVDAVLDFIRRVQADFVERVETRAALGADGIELDDRLAEHVFAVAGREAVDFALDVDEDRRFLPREPRRRDEADTLAAARRRNHHRVAVVVIAQVAAILRLAEENAVTVEQVRFLQDLFIRPMRRAATRKLLRRELAAQPGHEDDGRAEDDADDGERAPEDLRHVVVKIGRPEVQRERLVNVMCAPMTERRAERFLIVERVREILRRHAMRDDERQNQADKNADANISTHGTFDAACAASASPKTPYPSYGSSTKSLSTRMLN